MDIRVVPKKILKNDFDLVPIYFIGGGGFFWEIWGLPKKSRVTPGHRS
jgi:hypothetical protein